MKIYEQKIAPNARRVRLFLAEKGLLDSVEFVELDLQKGENRNADFRDKNMFAKIPVLELNDGTCISESVAICRYFEALNPTPSLFGVEALEQAQIEMWQRRCEMYFLNMVGLAFQHTSGYFADRMTPNKEWGEDCFKNASKFMHMLDKHLANSEFIAGDTFSIADITALITVDFARVIKLRRGEDQHNLNRWYDLVSARPSAKA
ncbi:glutathione S-transferase [Oleiphilus sp. HI0071]|nr:MULTISPECIES: glutathione S-transferase [unclassified Oleiphilus]KZY72482.1 glutathione S-transferase [Oleiphilus sp. HI0065]KZY83677.1 glutathione S-transferase [Oleiphilus sp. HI0071]KZZ04752.1 glutathione S-transferase [Oleiphilus sp. HI0073]KZZ44935.1 glutathione S-transferase [Oleiphilus sp. HI0118]KZZ52675.1 glutathione S-transferase [Oleiphilus sp. HI0122]KZZ70016.1 glutathione S-transferase [Oleiphilus sp. HI0130]KZZ81092.1 glutathione S-transferase [Oleiphilus sp. HI0133]